MAAVRTFPTKSDEKWKYTPLAQVIAAFEAATPSAENSITAEQLTTLIGQRDEIRVVTVNGVFAASLSTADLPSGVQVSDGTISVDADVALDLAVHIVHVGAPGESPTVSTPKIVVQIGARSRVTVVETFCGLPGAMAIDASLTLDAGDSAQVELIRVQAAQREAVLIGLSQITAAANADVHVVDLSIGGEIARHELDARFTGDGARINIHGLYVPVGGQQHDTVVSVDHAASHCASRQDYYGVVDGHAHGSFIGHIIVRPGTVDTDAHQSNRNLALTRSAEVNTRPWLEILADDVRCTHGATVGRLDAASMFYLQSRGIPKTKARSMLIEAFIVTVAQAIADEGLQSHVGDLIRAHVTSPGHGDQR